MMDPGNGQALAQSLIYAAVDDTNEMIPEDRRINKSYDTILIGKNSPMDSLALINLLVSLEDKVITRFAISLHLYNEIAKPSGPFATLGTLIMYVTEKLRQAGHE